MMPRGGGGWQPGEGASMRWLPSAFLVFLLSPAFAVDLVDNVEIAWVSFYVSVTDTGCSTGSVFMTLNQGDVASVGCGVDLSLLGGTLTATRASESSYVVVVLSPTIPKPNIFARVPSIGEVTTPLVVDTGSYPLNYISTAAGIALPPSGSPPSPPYPSKLLTTAIPGDIVSSINATIVPGQS